MDITGNQLRDEGMALADTGVTEAWRQTALATVEHLATTRITVTSDDVWASGLEVPSDRRALGPVMVRAASLGIIESTQVFDKSTRPETHSMDMRVWRSLAYAAPCPTCGRS